VETEEQLAFLRREQCAEMQGFLYSEPLSSAEFEDALRGRPHATVSASPFNRLRLTVE
jgi:EAL domain-containing protein (putative c-di-GMP-specific phosphodiesterase class I)